jgi:hypothetical protein
MCVAGVVFGSLSQNLSDDYMAEIMSTHGSLRSPYAVRCDHSSFVAIIDVLILVQIWSIGVLERICN